MTSTDKATTTKAPKNSDLVRFTHDGLPMHASHMLGGVAFHYTKGLGPDGGKLNADTLAELLYTLKDLTTGKVIDDIYKPGWSVKLPEPSGVVIGAIRPDQVEEYRAAFKAKREAAKATKTSATPDRSKARAAAADATDGAQATPATKKAPAKVKGVTKKAAGKTTGSTKPTKPATKKPSGASNPPARARADARAAAAKGKDQVTPIPKAKDAKQAVAARPSRTTVKAEVEVPTSMTPPVMPAGDPGTEALRALLP